MNIMTAKIALECLLDDCNNYRDWDKTDVKNWESMVDQLASIKEYISNE
jgi:hypothetical protein